jgi:hypothetical protein
MSHDRDRQEQPAKEQAPEAAPERTPRAPKLDAVTNIVEADDLFVSMVSLTDNAEIFRLEASGEKLFYGCFCRWVVCEDSDD